MASARIHMDASRRRDTVLSMADKEGATFLARFPPIQSAIKISGDGGMRVQLDIPESELVNALPLLAWRECVLIVTVKPETKQS